MSAHPTAQPQIHARFALQRAGFAMEVDLLLPGKGVTALFGQSGSGKTTILRAIAGLERHAGATISVNGVVWQDDTRKLFVPTHRRGLGMVFQEASLFPHLTVQGNLDFARKRAGDPEAKGRLEHILSLLGIGHLLARGSDGLSGGEKQRVAIARALLSKPSLLLMDEPLAALDGKRKEEVLPYLERIHAELDVPMLYVSHSVEEVARLADHVVLVEAGTVLASGPAAETLARLDLSNALADDAGVLIQGTVTRFDAHYDLLHMQAAAGVFHVAHRELPVGTALRLRILARDVSLALSKPADSSILNQIAVTVVAIWPATTPAHVIVKLDAGGMQMLARITRLSCEQLRLEIGKRLWAQVKAVALLSLPS